MAIEPGDEVNETNRLEAFSDGVMAIAITLLVLEIHVPDRAEVSEVGLARALLDRWPSYAAFITSFVTILVMWVNHHAIFGAISRVDHVLKVINGLLLMSITFLPFPTAVLAGQFEGEDGHIAAGFYAGTFAANAVLFNLLWRYASHNNRLLHRDVNPEFVRTISWRYSFGVPLYTVAIALAFLGAEFSFALCMLLGLFFLLPLRIPPVTHPIER
jgi:uncharacterized membrane protein